ncbi:MAG: transglutaminase-like domain-containing protein [Candidatus Hodarchaeales archaeon]|jgi:transglutaminase-like putative cysteine protease
MDSNEYLEPTFYIDSQSEEVLNLAGKLAEEKDKVEIAISIFNYVRDEIKYTIDISRYSKPEDMKASTTIQRKYGFCIPKSVLLVALYRANGFPSRLHFADIVNYRSPPHVQELMKTNIFVFHGYAEVFLDKWVKLTPSFESPLCERHDFPVCTFNGVEDATFKSYDNKGNLFVEYQNDRGVCSDLPYKEISDTFREYYGYHL